MSALQERNKIAIEKKLNHFQMLTGVLTTRPWQIPADPTKNNQLIRFFNVLTKTKNNQLIRFC